MQPVKVAVANDYEVIVRGVGSMLGGDERINVVALAAGIAVTEPVDIVLFDTFGSGEAHVDAVQRITDHANAGAVVIYTDRFDDELIDAGHRLGARGYLGKSLSGKHLADAIVRIHDGEIVVQRNDDDRTLEVTPRPWPGTAFGLTEREANVLALIVQGLDNETIADRLYVSINTIKSRIRTLYQKLGADNRVQAALWGVKHGFDPDHVIIWDE